MKNYIFSSPSTNGQVVSIKFYPTAGGTVNLGLQVLPFTWESPEVYGIFELYFILSQETCYIQNLEV
jgi:hypothetical protein